MLRMVEMARSTILNKRDFMAFEPFVLKQYKKLKFQDNNTRHLNVKLTYLYMIAHVLYRNKKFKEAQMYLADLYAEMLISKKSFYNKFYPKYLLLFGATLTFTGEVDKAIKLLEDARKNGTKQFSTKYQLNINFNLAVYYFLSQKYTKASRLNLEFEHSDSWYEKIMGREWVLRKNLSWIILQIELENFDIAETRIRNLEKGFSDLLEQKRYKQVGPFLNLLRWYLDDPQSITTREFYDVVQESFDWVGVEREDLLNVTFYSWMKSKMQTERFYYVLLGLVDL
ncbi:MAG: hypothetical protein MRY83_00735, partial [Flavobacteriales bacterium]|nr:hypothetical protein [Flavobacteriales bacterium]